MTGSTEQPRRTRSNGGPIICLARGRFGPGGGGPAAAQWTGSLIRRGPAAAGRRSECAGEGREGAEEAERAEEGVGNREKRIRRGGEGDISGNLQKRAAFKLIFARCVIESVCFALWFFFCLRHAGRGWAGPGAASIGTARLTRMAQNRDGPGAATAPAPEIQRQATAAVKLELASTPGARACYRVIRFRVSRTACWR